MRVYPRPFSSTFFKCLFVSKIHTWGNRGHAALIHSLFTSDINIKWKNILGKNTVQVKTKCSVSCSWLKQELSCAVIARHIWFHLKYVLYPTLVEHLISFKICSVPHISRSIRTSNCTWMFMLGFCLLHKIVTIHIYRENHYTWEERGIKIVQYDALDLIGTVVK